MKTKKTVIAVLTAALLISTMLIAGCMSQLDELSGKDAEDNYQAPAGRGIVRFKISDGAARTILPTVDIANRLFNIAITSTTPANALANNVSHTGLTYTQVTSGAYKTITLNQDEYNISIIATDASANPVASWNNGGVAFTVTGTTKNLDVVLKPYITTGQGTFTFDITASSNGITTFDILSYSGGTTIGDTYYGYSTENIEFPVTGTIAGLVTLDSGYYTVKITSALAKYQTIEYIHALHIYQNMTSDLALPMPTLVQNEFEVKYNLNGGDDTTTAYDPDPDENIEDVKYGNFALGLGTPVGSVDTFSGWYQTIGGSGAEWVLSENRITTDKTLYAKWTPPGASGINITITFPINEAGIVTGDTSISRAAFYTGTEIILKLADDDWASIEWSIGGIGIIGSPFVSENDNPDDTLTINNSVTFDGLMAGNFVVNCNAVKSDSTPYSNSVEITVTP